VNERQKHGKQLHAGSDWRLDLELNVKDLQLDVKDLRLAWDLALATCVHKFTCIWHTVLTWYCTCAVGLSIA